MRKLLLITVLGFTFIIFRSSRRMTQQEITRMRELEAQGAFNDPEAWVDKMFPGMFDS